MNFGELVKTKTFWVGVIAVASGIVESVFDGWSTGIEKIMLGMGLVTGRQSVGKAAKGIAR